MTAGGFNWQYLETEINNRVLWESHCHAQFEMLAVLEGDVSILLEGRSYRLTEHQALIIPPLLYHTVATNKSGIYRRITALFDLGAIPSVLRERFAAKDAELTIFSSHRAEELRQIGEMGEGEFYEPLAESLMVQLLYLDASATPAEHGSQTDDFLRQILSYVDEHLRERILLDDLAKHTSRSKSSVCHLFEEKMRVSPKQYVLQKKLALAAKLIHDGMPPTAAAMEVGYDNYSNFYRMYRKHMGTSPTKAK